MSNNRLPFWRPCMLLSEINNTTPFTCSLAVDTSRMNVGDQLFVSIKYKFNVDTNPQGARAKILLSDNMVYLKCGELSNSVSNAKNDFVNIYTQQTQDEFIFDGEYLICTYDIS